MMKRISLAGLVLAASVATAHAQYALPPGYPPELYIDQWGAAHWIWHDPYDVPHVGKPMPPPSIPPPPHLACYDEKGHFIGQGNPECRGPVTKG